MSIKANVETNSITVDGKEKAAIMEVMETAFYAPDDLRVSGLAPNHIQALKDADDNMTAMQRYNIEDEPMELTGEAADAFYALGYEVQANPLQKYSVIAEAYQKVRGW